MSSVLQEPATSEAEPLDLDALAATWQRALDAAVGALEAADHDLPAPELGERRGALAREREQTARVLTAVALVEPTHAHPWLSPVAVRPELLGLPPRVRACLFDVDGVLTDSAVLHAAAWADVFDELLLRLAQQTGRQFVPFDRADDYLRYLDGRPRLDGVHAFLGSRGIRLPEGRPEDPPGAESAYGLARRKSAALAREMRRHGVSALAGAHRYLDAAGRAGLGRGAVSASTTTLPMLEHAGLARLLDVRVDAERMRAERLRSRPAPDLLLAACRLLGVAPEQAVTFTRSPAGVAAGRTAGLHVVAVAAGGDACEELLGFGAERAVPSLATLLDRRLAVAA